MWEWLAQFWWLALIIFAGAIALIIWFLNFIKKNKMKAKIAGVEIDATEEDTKTDTGNGAKRGFAYMDSVNLILDKNEEYVTIREKIRKKVAMDRMEMAYKKLKDDMLNFFRGVLLETLEASGEDISSFNYADNKDYERYEEILNIISFESVKVICMEIIGQLEAGVDITESQIKEYTLQLYKIVPDRIKTSYRGTIVSCMQISKANIEKYLGISDPNLLKDSHYVNSWVYKEISTAVKEAIELYQRASNKIAENKNAIKENIEHTYKIIAG